MNAQYFCLIFFLFFLQISVCLFSCSLWFLPISVKRNQRKYLLAAHKEIVKDTEETIKMNASPVKKPSFTEKEPSKLSDWQFPEVKEKCFCFF